MREVKIINKEKFLKRIIMILFIILCIIFCFTKISFSHNNDIKEIKYQEMSVTNGDSLWSIACFEQKNNPYFYNKDVREIVYEIKKLNNLLNCNLYINQTLKIPIL